MSKYIEKYPWLRLRNLYTGELYKNTDAYDDILGGWQIAFGEMLLEELDAAIKKHKLEDTFIFEQVKEKFGRLVMYINTGNQEIHDIINKYGLLSENICATCGKPDIAMLNMSYIIPMCEDCYNKMSYRHGVKRCEVEPYDSIASQNRTMPTTMKCTRYEDNEKIVREIDISETVEAIRKVFRERTS